VVEAHDRLALVRELELLEGGAADLQDQLAAAERLVGSEEDPRPGALVLLVGEVGALAGPPLDVDLVAPLDEPMDAARIEERPPLPGSPAPWRS
jgi:hypothetical protein